MNNTFFKGNQAKLVEKIQDNSMVILFSGEAPKKSADEKYPFTTNRNFYYMCGIKEASLMFTLTKQNGEVKVNLYIKKHDPVQAKWVGATIGKDEARAISGIEEIKEIDSFEQTLHVMVGLMGIETLYFDLERDHFNQEVTYAQHFAATCVTKYPAVRIKDAYPIISKLRMVKEAEEIEQLRVAIDITDKGINALMQHAQSGMREYELEAYFDFELKRSGIKDFAFKTIAASGVNATILHYDNNDSIIPEDSLILFDLGAQYEYYNADITRTFPVSGKFTERQKTFYNIVLKAQLEVINRIKPGVTLTDLNECVKSIYFEELQKLGMVENPEDVATYYYHGVSHHLGLDTHDVGIRGAKLEEGMVITVEPGLYIEEEAIGIRIEDDVKVTKEGCEVLSSQVIKTVEAIEKFMAERSSKQEKL